MQNTWQTHIYKQTIGLGLIEGQVLYVPGIRGENLYLRVEIISC
jgi:hypothetical protein